MTLENMSKELQEKVKACKSIEELRDLCVEQGVELTEEELTGLAGGLALGICKSDGCGINTCIGDTNTCWLDTSSGPTCSFVLQ